MNADAITPDTSDATDAEFWRLFKHDTTVVNGLALHSVSGGTGKPILLIPGWPQSWYAWRRVMPLLVAAGRRVIVLEPRGLGDSAQASGGYALPDVAAEIHAWIGQTGLNRDGPPDVAGHDIGAWIAYALAADWPADIDRLALLDAALPGITPPAPAGIPSAAAVTRTWHFGFNRLEGLPEILVRGHEREFLRWMFNEKSLHKEVFTEQALDEYTRVFAAPGAAGAGFDYYRAAFSAEGLLASQERARTSLVMPVLALAGSGGVGNVLTETLRTVANSVDAVLLSDCGHYLPEECPQEVTHELLRFFACPRDAGSPE